MWKAVGAFVMSLLKWMFKGLSKNVKPKSQNGAQPGKLEKRLKAKIKKDGW